MSLEICCFSIVFWLTNNKKRSRDEKQTAATELKIHLITTSREISQEQFSKYANDINKKIFDLIHSQDPSDRLGGVLAIDSLIDFDGGGEENTAKITRFANYLRIAIPSNDIEVMRLAATALGRLAIPGGTLTAELVEFEAKRSLEWLQSDRQENRRHAAVLIIAALAVNSPTLLYFYVNEILDLIWVALRDPKVAIRTDAAIALRRCLDIVYERENALKQKWFNKLMSGAASGLKLASTESIHGSLLVYYELLKKGGMFMQDKYDTVYDAVFKYRDHKVFLIRQEVMNILPLLASYNAQQFVDKYLHRTMAFYLNQLKKDKDKSAIFLSLGDISFSVQSSIAPYLDAILDNIREGLSTKRYAFFTNNFINNFYILTKLLADIAKMSKQQYSIVLENWQQQLDQL